VSFIKDSSEIFKNLCYLCKNI